ncbi:DUF2683 family protein [Dyadobacter luticola]|uniref:Uncharacterized protein n=1 Tax=Dyadobacter luticola TaxID=1979387 RepID=A0A5R9KNQ6_9BACT|nr:DUF2683 family protein [Dyadobacter luticola]TLU97912.1 hypothetical protein FEN17_24275 [Dyadobacter luticola]
METLHVYPNKSQQKAVVAFLEALKIPFDTEESLPPHVLKGIQNGQEDIKSGKSIALEEFEKRRRSI